MPSTIQPMRYFMPGINDIKDQIGILSERDIDKLEKHVSALRDNTLEKVEKTTRNIDGKEQTVEVAHFYSLMHLSNRNDSIEMLYKDLHETDRYQLTRYEEDGKTEKSILSEKNAKAWGLSHMPEAVYRSCFGDKRDYSVMFGNSDDYRCLLDNVAAPLNLQENMGDRHYQYIVESMKLLNGYTAGNNPLSNHAQAGASISETMRKKTMELRGYSFAERLVISESAAYIVSKHFGLDKSAEKIEATSCDFKYVPIFSSRYNTTELNRMFTDVQELSTDIMNRIQPVYKKIKDIDAEYSQRAPMAGKDVEDVLDFAKKAGRSIDLPQNVQSFFPQGPAQGIER